MGDIVDFKSKGIVPVERVQDPRRVPPPPADGLVLACHCGSTLHELLNAGVVRCSRCGDYGKATWGWAPRPDVTPTPGPRKA